MEDLIKDLPGEVIEYAEEINDYFSTEKSDKNGETYLPF